MPQAHQKNANSAGGFRRGDFDHANNGGHGSQFGSYHAGWQGTIKSRLGKDAQLKFGCCRLSLQPAVDAVATPSGNIYTREYILEYLLTKKKELKRQRALYDAAQAQEAAIKKGEDDDKHEKKKRKFIDLQEGIVDSTAIVGKKTAEEVARAVAIGRRDGLDGDLKEKLKEYLKSNFWVPDMTPDSGARKIEKPQERPLSPCSQRPLKVTGIFSINLVRDETAEDAGKGNVNPVYMCPVSQKQITHQKVVAIRSTGTVMLKDCYEKFVKAELVDPVTQKPFEEKDVVELTSGGTGFAGHDDSQSEGTFYRPNMGGC